MVDAAPAEDLVPSDDDRDQSVLTDLKLGVSLPASLAAGLPALAHTVSEAEPVLPKIETPASSNQQQLNPPRVNPEALQALETLLGELAFEICFRCYCCV